MTTHTTYIPQVVTDDTTAHTDEEITIKIDPEQTRATWPLIERAFPHQLSLGPKKHPKDKLKVRKARKARKARKVSKRRNRR